MRVVRSLLAGSLALACISCGAYGREAFRTRPISATPLAALPDRAIAGDVLLRGKVVSMRTITRQMRGGCGTPPSQVGAEMNYTDYRGMWQP